MPAVLRSEVVHDCLMRVRFKYQLASPVTGAIIEHFSARGAAAQVYDAGRFLPGSRPVFQIRGGDDYLIAGAIGLGYVTVTYAKADRLAELRAEVEEELQCLP